VQTDRTELSRIERITLTTLAALSVALRAFLYFRYRFDSDEPQHLHVAWGWTVGLVQYRDYFDNHAPLFHMLSAPLLRALGERPDVLLYMRAPMLPLFAVVLACTYVIARRFYGPRVALWSVVMLSLYPSFFLKSLEYRTDNLWNALWMLALLVLTGGTATTARMLATGVILGIGACVSLKTSLLVGSLALAAIGTRFALREPIRPREILGRAAGFAVGFVLAPAALTAYFAHLGALPNLFYCVFAFNRFIAQTHAHVMLLRIAYPFMLAFVLWYGRRIAADTVRDGQGRTRFFLGMLLAMFAVTLTGLWVLISPRDLLPIMPLMLIVFCSWVVQKVESRRIIVAVFAALAAIFLASIAYDSTWFENGTASDIGMIDEALHLTRPDEPLMDLKGETVFRRRPYYYVFEKITRDAIRAGLLPDRVAEAVIGAKCHVVVADGPFFPARSRMFFSANYLDVGRLRASGQWVRVDGSFTIAVPARYVLLNKSGEAAGILDGVPYSGPRDLQPGSHRFVGTSAGRVACLWAPAFERGFSPFPTKGRDSR
jgi:Dolichyl-phosphate-mannose-protein mannosyltransferase